MQNFGYWLSHYDNDSGTICSRLTGFRLNSWVFPQGMTVTPLYPATTDSDSALYSNAPTAGTSYPSSSQVTGVANYPTGTSTALRSLSYTFDVNGALSGVADGAGRALTGTIAYGYPTAGMTDPAGALTTFAYTANQVTGATQRPVPYQQLSQIFTAENPTHPNVEYDYDSLGKITAIKDAEALQVGDRAPYLFRLADGTRGERDDPLYDPVHNPANLGYAVVFDTYGHPSRYIDELGRETDAVFDSRSRPYSYLYPEGGCELFLYDDHNNTLSYNRIDKVTGCNPAAAGNHHLLTRASWDATWNKPLTIVSPALNTTTFTYYNSGAGASLLDTATRPADIHLNNPVYKFTYDAAGKVATSVVPFTTAQNITTTNAYDALENLATSTLDLTGVDAVTTYGYDSIGNVTTTTDPRGAVTETSYDLDRRKTGDKHHDGAIGAALNAQSRTIYDVIGRDIEDDQVKCFDNATTCPASGTTAVTWIAAKTTTYTPTSKVATVTDADTRVTATGYDGLDRVLTVTDPVGRQDHFLYDAAGQTLVEYRAWQSPTLREAYSTSTYGNDGEKLTIADANANVTTYGYDGFDRLLTTTYPDSAVGHLDVETLSYDKENNIVTRINRAGQTLTYTYDALNRMLTKVMPAVTGVNPAVTTTWDYYLNGAIDDIADSAGNNLNTFNTTGATYYDTAGRLIRIDTTIPGITGALTTSYVLDKNSNRTQLTWPDGYYVTYAYDSLNRMTNASESGTFSLATYTYDPLSRRTNMAYRAGMNSAYTYTNAGDLTALNIDAATSGTVPHYTLGYTSAHQLNSEASSLSTYVWQPPTNGTDAYTAANNLNQYPSWTPAGSTSQTFTYDGNSNMTGGTIGGAAWTFAYDPENRLITANKTTGGTVAATYAYDPLGRRNEKSGTGVTTTYFMDDGTDEIAEYNTSGTATTRYVPGPAINERIAKIVVSSGARNYFQTDHHGSTIAVGNSAGAEIDGPFIYDSYGNCFEGTSPCSTVSGVPYKFVGMRLDAETGLYFDRARFYSSVVGRFLQTDSVGYDADLNLYTYGANDPLNKADPTGMACTTGSRTGGNSPDCRSSNGDDEVGAQRQAATIASGNPSNQPNNSRAVPQRDTSSSPSNSGSSNNCSDCNEKPKNQEFGFNADSFVGGPLSQQIAAANDNYPPDWHKFERQGGCTQASYMCIENSPPGRNGGCLVAEVVCNEAATMARAAPPNVTTYVKFPDGTVVVVPGGGRTPYVLPLPPVKRWR